MKRLLLLFFAVAALVACDTGVGTDGDKAIILTDGTQTNQSYYGNAAVKADAIKFKATAEWTAEVKEVSATKASEVAWLQLNTYSGKSGDNSISLTLLENQTGSSRKAEIIISSGEDKVIIQVEQKAEKEDVKNVRCVKKLNFYGGDFPLTFLYTYDDAKRVTKIEINDDVYTYTYSGSSIIEKDSDGSKSAEFTIGSNGYVMKAKATLSEDSYTYDNSGYLTRSLYMMSETSYRQDDYTWSENQVKREHTRDNDKDFRYTETMKLEGTYNFNTNFNYLLLGVETNLFGITTYFGKAPSKLATESVGIESMSGKETVFKYKIRFELDDQGCISKMYTQHQLVDDPTPLSSVGSRAEEWGQEELLLEIEYY